jgi:hypothetical protein
VTAGRQVAGLGREEGQGVVAPVVRQAALLQEAVLCEGVDRHQLQRRHAQPAKMVDDLGVGEGGERAALRRADLFQQRRQALHVRLVDHRLRPWRLGTAIAVPVERVGGDHRLRHGRGAIAAIEAEVAARRADVIAVNRVGPAQLSGQAPGVGVQQQLVRIEPVALFRRIGAIGAEAVELAGASMRQIAVPDLVGAFRQRIARQLLAARGVEQAEVHAFGIGREHRKIDAQTVKGRAERVGGSGLEAVRQ